MQAIERAWSDDGVLVLMDLGSAVLSAEMAVDLIDDERRERILLCEAPLVEGPSRRPSPPSWACPSMPSPRRRARGLAGKIAHLGTGADEGAGRTEGGEPGSDGAPVQRRRGPDVVAVFPVDVPHGLHARPAARFVQTASGYDATVTVRNLTTGAGPADASEPERRRDARRAPRATRSRSRRRVRGATEAVEALQASPRAGSTSTADRSLDAATEAHRAPRAGTAPRGQRRRDGLRRLARGRRRRARRFHTPSLDVPDTPRADPRLGRARRARGGRSATGRCDRRTARRGRRTSRRGRGAHLRRPPAVPARRGSARAGAPRRSRSAGERRAAWHDAVEAVAPAWDALDDEYLRARAVDLRSVGTQVLARILGVARAGTAARRTRHPRRRRPHPRRHGGARSGHGLGIVTAHGGPTSHAAVLARALGIPAVVGVGAGCSR